jgi:hypothetical protein
VAEDLLSRWWRGFGSIDADRGNLAAADGAGNVVVGANVRGPAQFDAFGVGATGTFHDAIAQLDGNGAVRWAVDLGDGYALSALSVNRSTGDVFAAGRYTDGTGAQSLFVSRYTKTGALASAVRYPMITGSITPAAGAATGAGDFAVTGEFAGTITLGTTTLTAGQGIFVATFSAAGATRWARAFVATDGKGLGIAAASNGTIAVTGFFKGTVDLGAGSFTSAAGGTAEDVFLADYSSGGIPQWAKHFGNASGARGSALAVAPNGDFVMTGSFAGALDFGRGTLTNPSGERDIFLARYSLSGGAIWSRNFVPAHPDGVHASLAQSVATDSAGNVVLGGSIYNDVDFGGGPLAAGTYDAFVAKFSPTGGALWSARWGGASDDDANAVTVDSNGNVVAAGTYAAAIGAVNATHGASDAFVASLNP